MKRFSCQEQALRKLEEVLQDHGKEFKAMKEYIEFLESRTYSLWQTSVHRVQIREHLEEP